MAKDRTARIRRSLCCSWDVRCGIAQCLFYRTPLQQKCCLPYRHMPEIADTTAAQAYRTEEECTHTYEAQRPSCSTHAAYAIPGFLRAKLARQLAVRSTGA